MRIPQVMLGLCEAKLQRKAEALKHLLSGRKLGIPDNPQLRHVMLYNEGMLLLGAGNFERAQETLDELARDGVASEELFAGLGRSVLGMLPGDTVPDLVRRAGVAEHFAAQRKHLAEALREYDRLAADYPKTHNVQFARGRFLLANHYDDQAVEAFERELENTPAHLLARLGIAGVKARTDPAGGLRFAEEAVKLNPRLAEGHFLLGTLLFETGQTSRAIAQLETARPGMQDDPRVYFALGRAYAKVNRKDDAARARAVFVRLSKRNEEERK